MKDLNIYYGRVSTLNQNFNRLDIDHKLYDSVCLDKVSGKIPFNDRPEGSKVITLVNKGVVKSINVYSIDRLGRNTSDVISTIEWLNDKGVNVIIQNIGLQSTPQGKPNPIFKMITSVLASIYDMERENILERTKMGRLNSTKKQGRPVGSTKSHKEFIEKEKSQQILRLLKKGRSKREISKILSTSSHTIIKVEKISNEMNILC